MYLLIKIRHNIIIQCHGNYIEVEKLGHFKKLLPKRFGCPEGELLRVFVYKRRPEAMLDFDGTSSSRFLATP